MAASRPRSTSPRPQRPLSTLSCWPAQGPPRPRTPPPPAATAAATAAARAQCRPWRRSSAQPGRRMPPPPLAPGPPPTARSCRACRARAAWCARRWSTSGAAPRSRCAAACSTPPSPSSVTACCRWVGDRVMIGLSTTGGRKPALQGFPACRHRGLCDSKHRLGRCLSASLEMEARNERPCPPPPAAPAALPAVHLLQAAGAAHQHTGGPPVGWLEADGPHEASFPRIFPAFPLTPPPPVGQARPACVDARMRPGP